MSISSSGLLSRVIASRSGLKLGLRTLPLAALPILSLVVLLDVGCSANVDNVMSADEGLSGYGYGYGYGHGYGQHHAR